MRTPHDALTRAAQDVFRNLMSGLPPLEEALALSLWPTPDVLASAMAPLIRVPQLHFSPAPATTGFPSNLPALMRAAKEAWIAEDITALLRRSDIRKNSKAWHRLAEMEKFCQKRHPCARSSALALVDHQRFKDSNEKGL